MERISERFLMGSELCVEPAGEGITRQILGYDGQLMVVKVGFRRGAAGAVHSHRHSQSSYVASGRFEVTIDGASRELSAGDGFYVAPDVAHGCVCLEEGTLIDAFSPMRRDFLG